MSDTAMTATAARSNSKGIALPRINGSFIVMTLYLLFLMLPIYWLVNMSLKTNQEILGTFSLWPQSPTLANYRTILTDPSWYMGYVNSLTYVVMNTVISITVAVIAIATNAMAAMRASTFPSMMGLPGVS